LELDAFFLCHWRYSRWFRSQWSHLRRDAECQHHRSQSHFLICSCGRRSWIPLHHLVPVLHAWFTRDLHIYCTTTVRSIVCSLNGQRRPHNHEHCLHCWIDAGESLHIWRFQTVRLNHFQNTAVAGIASSRLIWAVARDGVLPFSGWITKVSDKKEPRNAVIVMLGVASLLLCTILPSPVAFSSLVSAAGVPTITAYALIHCKSMKVISY